MSDLLSAPRKSPDTGLREPRPKCRRLDLLAVIALSLAVSLFAITTQSFWIDETGTGLKAAQSDLSGWWREMKAANNSDLQMPLYMGYAWVFAKLFGAGEWTLRACNIPWFVVGTTLLTAACSRLRTSRTPVRSPPGPATGEAIAPARFSIALLLLFCPFAWFYLDEARPYAMQFGSSALVIAALLRFESGDGLESRSWWICLFAGAVFLAGSSLLGMIWAAAALGMLAIILPSAQWREVLRKHRFLSCGTLLILGLTGLYYLWTLRAGARAGLSTTTTLTSILYIPYEVLGFAGLGPAKQELRANTFAALREYVPLLLAYGVVLAGIFASAAMSVFGKCSSRRQEALKCANSPQSLSLLASAATKRMVFQTRCMTIFKSPTHRVFKIVSLACLPALFLVLAGFLLHFRVVGRHFTPLVPAVLLLLAIGVSGLWWRRGWFSRLLVGLFFGLLVVSCLSLRLSPRHAKDDYRSAAAFAHDAQASGKDVWWCAAPEGARFYGLHLWPADAPEPQERAINVTNLPVEALPAAPRPAFVVISKPDLYDNQGTVARFLAEHHYLVILELPGFSIWAPRTGSGAQNWGE